MDFGSQDDGALRQGDFSSLDRIKAMGGNSLRLIISRERVGKEGWQAFDNIINEAHAKGIHPQVVLDNKEGFKGGGQGDPKKFEQFVRQAATHLKGRVGTYSLVNEPDLKMNPQKYRELFLRGQRALSKTDRTARVLFGEFSSHGGLDYASRVVGKGGITASGVAIHPYQDNDPLAAPDAAPWGIGKGRTMQKAIRGMNIKTRAKKTPGLYYTEFGYSNDNPNAAAYWPRALQAAKRAGVKELIAYTMSGDPGTKPDGTPNWDTGLFNPDGTPRDSYNAIMQARGR